MFSPLELGVIVQAATGQIRAMILLALNGGMYAADVAAIRASDLVKEGGGWVLDFDRAKTGGIPWKFPLWPETSAAVELALANRPRPRDPADADRLFITVHGRPFHREHVTRSGDRIDASSSVDMIAQEFDKLLANVWVRESDEPRDDGKGFRWRRLKREGVSFGTFRHTHVSAVGDHPDQFAAKRARGHRIASIEKHYDKLPLHRLQSVVDLARSRLLPQ